MSGKNLTVEQVNEIVDDDITYWLGNRFMPPDLLAEKVCWWVTIARTTPTPEPSEVAETAAGERRLPNVCRACGDCYHPSFGPNTDGEACDWCRDCGCPSAEHPAEPDAREVEALAKVLTDEGAGQGSSIHSWRCDYPDRYGKCDCVVEVARAVLASDWLAAHVSAAETKARADERERIAQAIEATAPSAPSTITPATVGRQATRAALLNAASIARGDAR